MHAAEMLQLCVLHKLHVATAVCLVKVKLLILPLLCKRGTMWTRVRCGRRSGTADGYFNKAHGEDGELWNHYQVLLCVSWEGQWMPGQHCSNTPLPPSNHWPISPLRGIKPLHTVIAFADPLTDPIGSWENGINWWPNPATAELWTGNFTVLCQSSYNSCWRPNTTPRGPTWMCMCVRAHLWACAPQAPCLLVRMLTIFCFNWLAVTWSLCLVALIRWSHIFSSSFLSAAYWAQLD